MSAEELAERLAAHSWNSNEQFSADIQSAAALIRSQAARIAELERRQMKVRWEQSNNKTYVHAFVGYLQVGYVFESINETWAASLLNGSCVNATTESEARAAVEAEAVKMMGGE